MEFDESQSDSVPIWSTQVPTIRKPDIKGQSYRYTDKGKKYQFSRFENTLSLVFEKYFRQKLFFLLYIVL